MTMQDEKHERKLSTQLVDYAETSTDKVKHLGHSISMYNLEQRGTGF